MNSGQIYATVTISTNGRRCEDGPGQFCPYASQAVDRTDGRSSHYCHLYRVHLERDGDATLRTAQCLADTGGDDAGG